MIGFFPDKGCDVSILGVPSRFSILHLICSTFKDILGISPGPGPLGKHVNQRGTLNTRADCFRVSHHPKSPISLLKSGVTDLQDKTFFRGPICLSRGRLREVPPSLTVLLESANVQFQRLGGCEGPSHQNSGPGGKKYLGRAEYRNRIKDCRKIIGVDLGNL